MEKRTYKNIIQSSIQKANQRKNIIQYLEHKLFQQGGNWENVEKYVENGLDVIDAMLRELQKSNDYIH